MAGLIGSRQLEVKNTSEDVEPYVAAGDVAVRKQAAGIACRPINSDLAMLFNMPGCTGPELAFRQVRSARYGAHLGDTSLFTRG